MFLKRKNQESSILGITWKSKLVESQFKRFLPTMQQSALLIDQLVWIIFTRLCEREKERERERERERTLSSAIHYYV